MSEEFHRYLNCMCRGMSELCSPEIVLMPASGVITPDFLVSMEQI
jgi:hypothetical protein